ncbi:MAG TPA: diguanylate cyclase [Gaiellaceae bacterium]|jgi:diguanylate cyclase (GGDEF)-like protein
MSSFKAKLALYFLLLSLVPVAAAYLGFTSVASRSETRRVDTQLQAGLRAALVAYQARLDGAQARAETLARSRTFDTALEQQDRATIKRFLRGLPDVAVVGRNGFAVGKVPPGAAVRQVDVVTGKGPAGRVIGYVAFDDPLAADLRDASGLRPGDVLAVVRGSRIVASAPRLTGTIPVASGLSRTVPVGGTRYRALVADSLGRRPGEPRLAVLRRQAVIDSANQSTRLNLLLFLFAALLVVAVIAWLEGRSIVLALRSVANAAHGIARGRLEERVPVRGRDEFAQLGRAFNEMADQLEARLAELEAERERLREAFAHIGDALGATHDPDQLLRVVLQTSLQATGATGAMLIADRGEHVEAGDPHAGAERLDVPLAAGQSSFGTLVLTGSGFNEEQRLTAVSLAAQAVVALENARLHRIVERQALVDPLTGLANRRRCEEALATEVARAERFATPLTLVFADLDDFKRVNDLHGHPVGDAVLRELATVLRESARESDLAGRWGGEEFLLLLPGTDAAGGARLAERIRVMLEERTILSSEGVRVSVTCSFGVAAFPAAPDGAALVAAADRALYLAKRMGKNRVESDVSASQRP